MYMGRYTLEQTMAKQTTAIRLWEVFSDCKLGQLEKLIGKAEKKQVRMAVVLAQKSHQHLLLNGHKPENSECNRRPCFPACPKKISVRVRWRQKNSIKAIPSSLLTSSSVYSSSSGKRIASRTSGSLRYSAILFSTLSR